MVQNVPADLSEAFFVAWVAMAKRLGLDPLDPLRVAFSESGCFATAHNANGDAVGLIGFMPQTLLNMGWTQGWDAFRKLPAELQVPYVEKYFGPYARFCTSDALCYVATFLPALLPRAAAMQEGAGDFVLCALGGPLEWAYRANPVFDPKKAGKITVNDMRARLEYACRGPRWDAICARMKAAAAGQPPPAIPEPPPTQPENVEPDPFVPADPYDDHGDE